MTITTKISAFTGATALAVTALTGVQIVGAAPAEAAVVCATSELGWWSVYNKSCSSARHFNRVNGAKKYAEWVGKKASSRQMVCWAGATSFGVEQKA